MSGRVPMWRRYLRFFGADPGADVDDELRFHLEERVDALVAAGWSEDAARREARRRLGDVEGIKRELTAMGERTERSRQRRESWLGAGRDARYAVRRLTTERGFALMALATLALGIGAAVAMFTVVNAIVLRPLPYAEAERLVRLSPDQNFNIAFADAVTDVPAVEASTGVSFWGLTLLGSDAHRTEQLNAQVVDAGFFDVFRTQPALGRAFRADEREPDRSGVVILSDGLWRTRFGADPGIVGQRVRLDGYGHESREVIGVMPRGFEAWGPPGQDVQVWIPLSRAAGRTVATDSTWYVNFLIARLAPGATVEQAGAQVRARTHQLVRDYPGTMAESSITRASAVGLLESMVGDVRETLLIMLAAVALVVVLACANLSNLLLARAERRRQELAVRSALGAGRLRLVREQLIESLVLALLGGAIGVLLARALLGVLRVSDASGLPRGELTAIDARVLTFAFGLSLLAALGFGLIPALRATRADLRGDLGSGARQRGSTRAGRRVGFALVASEVALATVLVVGAGLLLNSLRSLRAVQPGLDASDVLAIEVAPPVAQYEGDRKTVYYDQVSRRIAALPGVRSVGAIHLMPFTFNNWAFPYLADGMTPPDGPLPSANYRVVTPGYFETVDQPLQSGRGIEATDRAGTESVMVINRTFAEQLWPGESPLGRVIRLFGSEPATVIGVVGDVHQAALDLDPQPEMYVPLAQARVSAMVVMVETERDAAGLAALARAEIEAVDGDVPIVDARPLDEVLGDSMARRRFFAGVLTFFGLLALLLGAVGVYGVMSYVVVGRRAEYGVRMALGATRRDVLRGALTSGLTPIAIGLALGLAGALAGGRLLTSLLYGIEPGDPATVAAAALTLALVAVAAVAIPAVRFTRVDAARVLRAD